MDRLLGHGVDTLVLNLYWPEGAYRLPDGLESTLDVLKELYRVNPEEALLWGVDAYFPLPNPSLDPDPTGELRLFEVAGVQSTRHYAWQLSLGGLVFVRLSRVKDTVRRAGYPAMRVELTGTYMMYAGRRVDDVVAWIREAATVLVGTPPARLQVSRADLFADVELGRPFELSDLDRFTSRCRAKGLYAVGQAPAEGRAAPAGGGPMNNMPPAKRLQVPDSWLDAPETVSAHVRGREWSGFVFGRGPLMARVYSKSVEARTKPVTRALLRMYEEQHGPIHGHVVRVEFQLTTEALAEIILPGDGADVRDWDAFRCALSAIWAYLTQDWLQFRARGNYSRMRDNPVDPLWILVQSAFTEGGDIGKVVRHKWQARVDVKALARQALGAFMTALVAVGKATQVDFSWAWRAMFKALDLNDGMFYYADARARKLAMVGQLTPERAFGGV